MHDDFQPDVDALADLDGATARRPFPRVLVAGEEGSEARRDATALAAALTEHPESVTVPERADLIVAGSTPSATPGRVTLDPADRRLIEGARCPAAVAPRGLAGRDDYGPRRIDVGIDGSRGAAAALALGMQLAVGHSARLRLIAVAELAFDPAGSARRADPREVERLAHHLDQAIDRLSGIEVETELREGVADQIVIDLARDADLLVLGSRTAYGNAGRVVLGEVAARILQGAFCPVMVSRPPGGPRRGAWSGAPAD